jgi:hypothetical protein
MRWSMQFRIQSFVAICLSASSLAHAAPTMLLCESKRFIRDANTNARVIAEDTSFSAQITFDEAAATVSIDNGSVAKATVTSTLIDWEDKNGRWHIDRLTGHWSRFGTYQRNDFGGHFIPTSEEWFGICRAPPARKF